MLFRDLEEVEFLDLEISEDIDEALKELSKRLDKPIFPASPERLMLLTILQFIYQQKVNINDVGKMNLLKSARGDYLDALGALWDEYRQESQKATCTVEFKISTALPYVLTIGQGTRVKSSHDQVFQTTTITEVPPGEQTVEVVVEAMEPGVDQNGIPVGQIKTCIDIFPYYQSVKNITKTQGGMDLEDDESFRQRIHEAPEKLSTAGPDGAYIHWARQADKNINDVQVWSPKPGVVNVVPLYQDGSVPEKDVLDKIADDRITANGITRKRRPLTDQVNVIAPEVVTYDIEVKFWIDKEFEYNAVELQKQIMDGAKLFTYWQKERLGRDINPSELVKTLVQYGAKRVEVISPAFTKLSRGQIGHVGEIKLLYQGAEEE